MRLARLLGPALVAVLVVLLAPTSATLAGFTDRATTSSPTSLATAGTLAVPAAPAVGAGVGGVAVRWQETLAAGGAGPVPATGYQVFRYAAATGTQDATQVCPATAGQVLPADARSCTAPTTLTGGTYYAVVARFAVSWRRESTRTQAALDVTPPSIVHSAPTNQMTAGSGPAFANVVAGVCTAGGVACGTATDPSAPVTVQYALTRRPTNQPLSSGTCWDGSAYQPAPLLGGCVDRPALVSGSAWRVPGTPSAAYTGNGATLTLRITATDAAGNTATSTITFSY